MRKINEGAAIALGLMMMGLVGCDTSSVDENTVPEPTPPLQNMEARKAQVGVGEKGSKLRADDSTMGKMMTSSARAYFDVREKAVFEIQVPQALSLYRAQDSFGKGPQSHEEFMEKIIRCGQI